MRFRKTAYWSGPAELEKTVKDVPGTCLSVEVGFIALAGVAAETGVIMLIYLDHA